MTEADFKSAVYRLGNLLQAAIGFIELEQYSQALSSLEVHIEEAQALAERVRQHQCAQARLESRDGGGFP